MVVTLHHLENSRSQRVLWLLEELGIEYEIKHYKRTQQKLAPPELKKVHPLRKSPVITDNGLTIAETGLIVEYLIGKYGPQLAPPKTDEAKTLQYKYWLHFSEGTVQPVLVMSLLLTFAARMTPFLLRPFAKLVTGGITRAYVGPNISNDAKFMDEELGKNSKGWFVDEFSGADIILSFPVECIEARSGLSEYPHLRDYIERIHSRPAYKKALEKGGEFKILG